MTQVVVVIIFVGRKQGEASYSFSKLFLWEESSQVLNCNLFLWEESLQVILIVVIS